MDTFMKLVGATGLVLVFLMFVALVLGLPVMWLWNSTMPEIFTGLGTITFWQAVRLNILCAILFKGTSSSSSSSK
jgi:hypothetical protein